MRSKKLINKTLRMAFALFINKPIGFLRDVLRIKYMGVGIESDSFSVAWRIPNMLRRILGEGTLQSVLLPTLIYIQEHDGKREVDAVVTAIFFLMMLLTGIICFVIAYFSKSIVYIIAPGALSRVSQTAFLLQILIFFTFK